MLDFFDFLAGEKLYLPNEETAQLEKQQIYFKFVAKNLLSPPEPKENKAGSYKPVKIVNVELKGNQTEASSADQRLKKGNEHTGRG